MSNVLICLKHLALKRGWCRLTSHYYILPFLQVKLPYADLKQNLFFGSALRSTGAGGRETTGKTRPKTTQGAMFSRELEGALAPMSRSVESGD